MAQETNQAKDSHDRAHSVDTTISGQRMTRYLDEISIARSLPRSIVMDNRTEMTSKAMFLWSQRTGVKLQFI